MTTIISPHHSRFRIAGIVALVVGIVLITLKLIPVLKAGSGYAAKNLCSGYFISGFHPDLMIDQALVGASPLLSNTDFKLEIDTQQVTARLYGLFPRTAKFDPNIGCTLLPDGTQQTSAAQMPKPKQSHLDPDVLWPNGTKTEPITAELKSVLKQAFAERDLEQPRNTKAIVVVHKGRLVAEHYAEGVGPETPLIGWSMTKTITNLLVGLLVKDNLLNIDHPAPVALWQQSPRDPRSLITVSQLLRMSSGLAFDEDYGLYSDVTRMLSNEPDMFAFAAAKPLISEPGTAWSYSSGTTNIVAGIVSQLTGGGRASNRYIKEQLFEAIGATSAVMEFDASGTFIGSSYMYASARDWARFGLLCLQNGRWADKQLLPENWMAYSTTPAPANPANNYGAHVWLNLSPESSTATSAFPLLPTDTYAMDGYQGQMVVMVPSHELLVVRLGFTPAGNHGVQALVADIMNIVSPPTAPKPAAGT